MKTDVKMVEVVYPNGYVAKVTEQIAKILIGKKAVSPVKGFLGKDVEQKVEQVTEWPTL